MSFSNENPFLDEFETERNILDFDSLDSETIIDTIDYNNKKEEQNLHIEFLTEISPIAHNSSSNKNNEHKIFKAANNEKKFITADSQLSSLVNIAGNKNLFSFEDCKINNGNDDNGESVFPFIPRRKSSLLASKEARKLLLSQRKKSTKSIRLKKSQAEVNQAKEQSKKDKVIIKVKKDSNFNSKDSKDKQDKKDNYALEKEKCEEENLNRIIERKNEIRPKAKMAYQKQNGANIKLFLDNIRMNKELNIAKFITNESKKEKKNCSLDNISAFKKTNTQASLTYNNSERRKKEAENFESLKAHQHKATGNINTSIFEISIFQNIFLFFEKNLNISLKELIIKL